MKLLLDTHIWLWSALQPDRLTQRVSRALANPENELWLSAISVWELTVLCRKRRFDLPSELSHWVTRSMQDLEVSEAPLTIEVALAVSSMNLPHGDPADRFIAASAKVFALTLVTADRRLLETPGIQVLANR